MERAVVLVGGSGEGVKLLTGGKPKSLLRIAGKAIIEYVIDGLISCGFKEVILVADQPKFFEDLTVRYGRLIECRVIKQVGSDVRGAILSAREEFNKPSLLVYGDTLVPDDAYRTIINTYVVYGKPVIMVIPEEDVKLYGAVKIGAGNRVEDFIEKPHFDIEGAYAYGGVSIVDRDFIDALESSISVEDAFKRYISTKTMIAALWSGWWVDIGYPWDILKALNYILSGLRESRISASSSIAPTAVLKGPLVIDDEATIDHFAVLKGPLYIGKGCEVGTHTLLRQFTSVESMAVIGSYSEVVWSSIQPRATIGRGSFTGFSVIGEEAIVEPNVITKTILREEMITGAEKPIEVVKRYAKYFKLGSFIGRGARVRAGSVLEAGSFID